MAKEESVFLSKEQQMHLSMNAIDHLPFHSFRKRASFRVRARRLTEEDVKQRAGVIQTMEGPATFRAGDYLARGTRGEEYPIRPAAFAILYEEGSQEPDTEGFAWYRPAPLVHQAIQITEPFSMDIPGGGLYTGQPGDYLVRTVGLEGDPRIVDRWYFEQYYEPIDDV
jgi:hypothetical protein